MYPTGQLSPQLQPEELSQPRVDARFAGIVEDNRDAFLPQETVDFRTRQIDLAERARQEAELAALAGQIEGLSDRTIEQGSLSPETLSAEADRLSLFSNEIGSSEFWDKMNSDAGAPREPAYTHPEANRDAAIAEIAGNRSYQEIINRIAQQGGLVDGYRHSALENELAREKVFARRLER